MKFREWPSFSRRRSTCPSGDINQERNVRNELKKTLVLGAREVMIAVINIAQDYKINGLRDTRQHTPNARMYWIPGDMMLNAISGIAPIS